jgi:hypothetical protein
MGLAVALLNSSGTIHLTVPTTLPFSPFNFAKPKSHHFAFGVIIGVQDNIQAFDIAMNYVFTMQIRQSSK